MEEEGVGLALAKATELRLKISNYVQKATAGRLSSRNEQSPHEQEEEKANKFENFNGENLTEDEEGEEEEEEAERLLGIRDGLESLESQLVALQNLQHQQQYEKEVALAEIDYSRKILLEKLEKYRGKDLDVILEATAFVSKTVENNDDLLLPPYPSLSPRSLVLDNGYFSHLQSTHTSLPNGVSTGEPTNEVKNLNGHHTSKNQDESKNSRKGLGYFIRSTVKTVLPLVGVIYILSLSNFVSNSGKGTLLKFMTGMLHQRADEEKDTTVQCPPGKVLVIEGGEARCLVKERIQVPFESIVAKPDVDYGCG